MNECGMPHIGEVCVGASGDPFRPVVDKLASKSVYATSKTVRNIRTGYTPGRRSDYYALCVDRYTDQDASKKDRLYQRVANRIIEVRKFQPRPPFRFGCQGLIINAAEKVKLEDKDVVPKDITYALNGMRSDFLVFPEDIAPHYSKSVWKQFLKSTDLFLEHQKHPNGNKSAPLWVDFANRWDGSPATFYRFFKERGSALLLASWVPYEAEIMEAFYRDRLAQPYVGLTFFDEQCLEAVKAVQNIGQEPIVENNKIDEVALQKLCEQSPVNFNIQDFFIHTRALTYGRLSARLRTKNH